MSAPDPFDFNPCSDDYTKARAWHSSFLGLFAELQALSMTRGNETVDDESSILQQELDKPPSNRDPIMGLRYHIHVLVELFIVENTLSVPYPHDLRRDLFVEFWMTLDGDEMTLLVHPLHPAYWT